MMMKGRRRAAPPVPLKEAPPAPKPPTLDLDEVWRDAAIAFSNRRGMKLRRNWSVGISERAFADRFAKATTRPPAKRMAHRLGLLSDTDLRVFHTRAAVNHEQAVAGTRFTLIANVSVPLGFVLLLNALLPGALETLFAANSSYFLLFVASFVLTAPLVFGIVWYCYAGVQQARDLYHLATLEMARRGVMPTLASGDQNPTETKP